MMHLHKENFVPKRLLSQINIGYRLYFYKNGDLFECRQDFTDSSVSKESTCSAGDPGLIPRLGRSAGEGMGYPLWYSWASLVAQLVKNLPANTGDLALIPGLGRSPGEGKGYPLQYSCLKNSMDCIVPGVAKSQTQLSDFHLPYGSS